MLRSFLRSTLRSLFTVLAHLEVDNLENIPLSGATLLVHNHLSRLDAPLVFMLVPRDDVTWLVAHTYRRVPVLNWFINSIHGIWINRETADHLALRLAFQHLQKGGLLGIAPEGYISHTGGLKPAKSGVAYLATKGNVQIVPLAISGTEKVFYGLVRLRRVRIKVRVGEAFTLPPVERSDRTAELEHNTEEIMCRIASLLPEENRGVYRENPRVKELLAGEK
jgi:1-acyl-sn-glycerol-3-phosphate acyltransferase